MRSVANRISDQTSSSVSLCNANIGAFCVLFSRVCDRDRSANGGRELFLSYENADKTVLYAFLRLRLSPNAGAGCVLVCVLMFCVIAHPC
jgi:hypothetical protein